eukprot:969505-Amphidinium_carterae.1
MNKGTQLEQHYPGGSDQEKRGGMCMSFRDRTAQELLSSFESVCSITTGLLLMKSMSALATSSIHNPSVWDANGTCFASKCKQQNNEPKCKQ